MAKQINIKVARIDNLLKDKFGTKIDMSDSTEPLYSSCYYSRALAATALMIVNKISLDAAASCITDGRDDFGIDAIYINNQQKIITFVQAKHHDGGTKTISRDELLLFEEGVTKLVNSDYSGVNSRILKMKNELDVALTKSDYKLVFCLIFTGGELNSAIDAKFKKMIGKFNCDNDELATAKILNLEEIYNYIVVNHFEEKVSIDNFCLTKLNHFESPQDMYFGLVKATDLVGLYKKYGNSIFSSNIRYFKGDTKVNEGIIDVISNKPSKFILYNNGVKAICESITRLPLNKTSYDVGYFKIDGFSIVNGAQTTGSLSTFSDEQLENVYVFITIISLENSDDKELANDITTLSNTQNKIEFIDFASIDPWHQKIKSELWADGKEYVYMDGESPSINSISLYTLTNALSCFLSVEASAYVKNGYNSIFKDISKPAYKKLFNSGVNHYFVWNVATFYDRTYKLIESKALSKTSYEYSIPIHGVRFICNLVFDYLKGKNVIFEQNYLNYDDYLEDVDSYVNKLIPVIKDELVSSYKDEIIPNVFRTKKKSKSIKEAVLLRLNSI